ncbi:acetyl esterase/lipase [Microbacterium immunditiarum]|uniref:Acetyl esterase/lipase n=1 Tax=Microbacterium immunditiarum TaxID=337480 RepID=A0A7Y9GS12_9MICO|nr:acetyl esterase/lipase [Microbacterium immunditiarum]
MLILPGGGYQTTSDREAEPIALAFLSEGYNAFLLRYRADVESTFGQALTDAEAAMRYLQENAESLAIDASRIITCGFSAGGHLASALGTISNDKPAAQILLYPVILSAFGERMRTVIPSTNDAVTADTPPTFLAATRSDHVVPISHTLAFANALDDAGVPFELHVYGTGPHGLSLGKTCTAAGSRTFVDVPWQAWFGQATTFLKHHIGEFDVA